MTSTADAAPVHDNFNWLKILELGRYAPTPHNTQWYFLKPLDETTAQVGIDDAIQLPHTDPDDQFRFTGLGLFVRHLEMSAEAVGLTLTTEYVDGDEHFPITVRITGECAPNAQLSHLIKQRQTSRLAYQKEPISAEAAAALTAVSNSEHTAHISSDPKVVTTVLELNNDVLLNDLQDKGVGDELDHWIRYSKSSEAKYGSGFTPDTLGLPAWKIWMVFRFRFVMRLGTMKKWLTSEYFKQNSTGTVGWLYGPLTTRREQYNAGRFMMDFWMKVAENGYYMQPYGSIITNLAARQSFLKGTGQTEENGKMVWLAFRVGTSQKPAVSPRKPIAEYLR